MTYYERNKERSKRISGEYREAHRLFNCWYTMLYRCCNPKYPRYYLYGGRIPPVAVCKEWLSYNNYQKWALDNGWKPGLHIHRIDNDCNYEPSNCIIITGAEHCRITKPRKGKFKKANQYKWYSPVDIIRFNAMLEARNKGMTYQTIADMHGLTRQRVQQILTS